MKKTFILLLVLTFLCGTLTACGEASNSAAIKADDLKEIITAYVEDDIKSVLKNPQSLMINNLAFNEDPIEIAGRCYCNLDVDFSAQNGFGGYDREVVSYYLCYEDGNIESFDRWDYYCELDTARYGVKLDAIEDGAFFSYACSSNSAKTTYSDLSEKGVNTLTAMGYGFTDNIDKTAYVHYICEIMGFEGSIEYFFSDDKILWAEYSWYPDQGYLDMENTNYFNIGIGETASSSDMDMLITKIDNVLGIEHTETESQNYQSWADPRAYQWILSPHRKLTLEYVWEIENVGGESVINYEQVASFDLAVENDISE